MAALFQYEMKSNSMWERYGFNSEPQSIMPIFAGNKPPNCLDFE